jgi:predicted O-methyltransferase YrrM
MSITPLITAILSLLILGLLVALALKLRRWVWEIHSNTANLRSEISDVKESNAKLAAAISDAGLEAVNATCLASLGLKFPVFLGGWSIDSFLARWLVQHILERRPKCIVELGSGSSTILIARTLNLLGENEATHIAVDHEEKYLGLTRDVATLNGVSDGVEFMHCPLVRYESLDKLWYDGLAGKLADCKIDLLIIDGPPAGLQPNSRYPALPVLLPFLNKNCTILLDDSNRPHEEQIAKRWHAENPDFNLSFFKPGHGFAVLSRQ